MESESVVLVLPGAYHHLSVLSAVLPFVQSLGRSINARRLIDLSSGAFRPITPEGFAGVNLSPDGKTAAVLEPMATGAVGLDNGGIRLIPGLTSKEVVTGWFPDGKSLYTIAGMASAGLLGRPEKAQKS